MTQLAEGRGHHGQHEGHEHHECESHVTIVVDNTDVYLHHGHYQLDVVKQLAKVSASDDLDQLVGTQLVAVSNDKPIEIRGGEIFISHPKSGGSS